MEAAVARSWAEILELDQSLELMEQETEAQGRPMGLERWAAWIGEEKALMATPVPLLQTWPWSGTHRVRKIPSACSPPPGSSWGHAKTAAWAQERMQRLQNQLKRLQDIERWASGVREHPHQAGRMPILRDPVLCPDPFWVLEF